ncbi:unnamed protein product, partial [Prorocentrum cordatum]
MFPACGRDAGVDPTRCVRVLPSERVDTGGFFAAALTKRTAAGPCAGAGADAGAKAWWQLWAACRFDFARLKRTTREAPAVLNFFGLLHEEAAARAHGVERFPLEAVAWAPKRTRWAGGLLVLAAAPLQGLQHHAGLPVAGGGMPLLVRMRDDCAWARNAGLSDGRDFFTWRPEPGASAAFLARY